MSIYELAIMHAYLLLSLYARNGEAYRWRLARNAFLKFDFLQELFQNTIKR